MPAVQAQSTPGFRIVFPSGSASVSAFVKHWFLLPLPLGALVPWVAQKRLGHCQLDLRAPHVCFKPLFLPPPPLEGASSSPAGPGPPAHILTTLPVHSHLFGPPSLRLCPILWCRGPCGSAGLLPHSRAPSFLLEWITGSKSS